MPDTRPDAALDENGICSACRGARLREQIDWAARKKELGTTLEKYRSKDGSNYDCIIPVSGGKDSTFQTYIIKRVFGLNPLCVTFAPCKSTELGKKNLRNMIESLEVDHIHFTPNPAVYRKLFKLGFEKVGDPCWPCHVGIFTYPVRVAVQYKVPLIIWAGDPEQSNGTLGKKWLYTRGGLLGKRPEDWVQEGLSLADLKPYIYPPDEEIDAVGVIGLFLGHYVKWDARAQVEIVTKECGFSVKEDGLVPGAFLNYENLDCGFVDIHDYLMYLKYGFGRATTQACINVQNGRMTRDEAFKLAEKYDGKVERVKEFCDFIGITPERFWEIAESFRGKDAWMKDAEGKWVKSV
ncbi:N-acetyl sugar amidotransferase [Chloroflexota bacterium]